MMAMFKTSVGSPMSSPFAFPSVLCQLANNNASCVSDLIGYYKTCACVDFQPMYDLTCPASPTHQNPTIFEKSSLFKVYKVETFVIGEGKK
jgi:hypothetical protein